MENCSLPWRRRRRTGTNPWQIACNKQPFLGTCRKHTGPQVCIRFRVAVTNGKSGTCSQQRAGNWEIELPKHGKGACERTAAGTRAALTREASSGPLKERRLGLSPKEWKPYAISGSGSLVKRARLHLLRPTRQIMRYTNATIALPLP